MLILGSQLTNAPVMSLQTGACLGVLGAALVNPANLQIIAYTVEGPLLVEHPTFIRTAEIREYGRLGVIIDSNDDLIGLEDVIRIKELYNLHFSPIGMHVIDQTGHKLGKVEDYTLDISQFSIQQLSLNRGLLRSFAEAGLLVHRSQIVEINDTTIVVKSTAKKVVEPIMQSVRSEFVNPFRQPNTQPSPESSDAR